MKRAITVLQETGMLHKNWLWRKGLQMKILELHRGRFKLIFEPRDIGGSVVSAPGGGT